MAEEVAGVKPKKQRTLQLGASTAPLGYHYEGEKCSMLNGKPTLKLRRDKEGPREDIYGDLYARHEEIKEGKLSVTFHCCIEGFNNKSIFFFKTFTITVLERLPQTSCSHVCDSCRPSRIPKFPKTFACSPRGLFISMRSPITNRQQSNFSPTILPDNTE